MFLGDDPQSEIITQVRILRVSDEH